MPADRVGPGLLVLSRRNAQIVKTVEEQVVLGGQEVGEEAVEYLSGVVIGLGLRDGEGVESGCPRRRMKVIYLVLP